MAMWKFEEIILTSQVSEITINSIPQGGKELVFYITYLTSGTGITNNILTVNGDNNSNYRNSASFIAGAGWTTTTITNNGIGLGRSAGKDQSGFSNDNKAWTSVKIRMPFYAASNIRKRAYVESLVHGDSDAYNYGAFNAALYMSTTPVTSVTIKNISSTLYQPGTKIICCYIDER